MNSDHLGIGAIAPIHQWAISHAMTQFPPHFIPFLTHSMITPPSQAGMNHMIVNVTPPTEDVSVQYGGK